MNINDIKWAPDDSSDHLAQIFGRQRELIEKYLSDHIDKGLPAQIPISLHDSAGQLVLKDFAWRITEELGEALEARVAHADLPDHYDEEISDAFHFLIEFTILAGITEVDLINLFDTDKSYVGEDGLTILYIIALVQPLYRQTYPRVDSKRDYKNLATAVGIFVEALATTCNTLKNKPWKQTQMITDIDYFRKNLATAWIRFIQLCIISNISERFLYELYFKKSEVNKFRQRSNY